jgi:hypothetical protein
VKEMTAFNNRRLKGLAIDRLKDLGFNNVSASDSGSNVIVVTDTKDNIVKLLKIVRGDSALRRYDNMIDCYLTIGKINCKKLSIPYEPTTYWDDGGKSADVY